MATRPPRAPKGTRTHRRKDGTPYVQYEPEVVGRFLESLATGLSVAQVCKLPGMPTEDGVYRWLRLREEFRKPYEDAKRFGLERMANDIIALSDSAPKTKEGVMKARLQVDARKWVLSKLVPHVYGENIDVKHSGTVNVTIRKFAPDKDAG